MADYGLTPQGPNIKRLDVILNELHDSMTEKLGVNTRQNPQSLLNHLLTNIADRIAELWELGLDVYYSQYPSTAENIDLDNAAQYGGSTRETPVPSYYRILCTGTDGAVLPAGTLIASDTNPATQLVLREPKAITRTAFNTAAIKLAVFPAHGPLTAILNNVTYTFILKGTESPAGALAGLKEAITDEAFIVDVDEEKNC